MLSTQSEASVREVGCEERSAGGGRKAICTVTQSGGVTLSQWYKKGVSCKRS